MSVPRTPAPPAPDGDILDTEQAGPAAIRGGVLRVGGYLVGVTLSIVSSAILFRYLGVDDSGRYVTVLSLVALAAGVTDAGLVAIGVREMSVRQGAMRERLLPNLLGLRAVLTVLGIVGATAFALIAGYSTLLVVGTALAGVGLLLQVAQATLTVPLMSRLRLGAVTSLDLVRQVATVALIVALVVSGAGLLSFLALPIAVGAFLLILTALAVRGDARLIPRFDRAEWRLLLKDTLPYAVATAVAALYFRLAIILMSLISSSEQVGYFSVSFRIVDVLIVLPQLLVGAAYPIFARAARDDPDRLRYAAQRMFDAALLAGGGLAVTLGAAAPLAILIVSGPDFAPAAEVLRIQAAALAASFVAAALSYVLLSLRMHKEMLVTALAGLVVTVVATLGLVPPFEAVGAGIATALTEATIAVVIWLVLARRHPDVCPSLRAVPRWAVAVALAVAPAVVLGSAPAIVLGALALAVYVGAAFALRLVPDELVEQARSVAGRERAEPLRR